ncbi:MAG: HAD family hydrolase [Pyrinomonadaceae bacterium]
MKKPAVFVDRDGTLIEEVNFLSRVEDLRVFPFTRPALKLLKDNGYRVIVLTNQSGIARGKYTESDMHAIHDQIQAEVGGLIDAFYFCPHLPSAECACRKPNLGMIEAARADFEIDMERSWMIGDKDLDVQIAKNAGIRSVLVLTGYGIKHRDELENAPDFVVEDFGTAIQNILSGSQVLVAA